MVYIIILNWKGAADTLACLESLAKLQDVEYRLVICDNASPDQSYEHIRDGILASVAYQGRPLVELNREHAERYKISADEKEAIYLIQTGDNFGYAGGNNVGIRFSLNQADMQYVWLLNNDTEVAPDALWHLVQRCRTDPTIGICGSRLVYFYERNHLQGLGGVYNRWLGTTRHYAAYAPSDAAFDDEKVSAEIDYVIGAAMLLTRPLLEKVGLLCEEYFLYFEELDLSCRARRYGFRNYVATSAIVYHKEGASAGCIHDKSSFSDMLAIRNRLLFACKFYKKLSPFVWFFLIAAFVNRLKRLQFEKAINVIKVMFLPGSFNLTNKK